MKNVYVDVLDEIKDAIAENQPVVALESTVIAHGLPRPYNLDTAQRLQDIVRSNDAIPATIAILDGIVKIGLTNDELEQLANADNVIKVSRRDFANVVTNKLTGATTVASTMIAASWAGINIIATGGIGGVHRGSDLDVSADLPEITRTSMIVVCSGAKAILDLPATLEWLETYGVPVVGYGVDELPAFYSQSSGILLDIKADNALEVAELWKNHNELGMSGGMLVTVPPPSKEALSSTEIEIAITSAIDDAVKHNVKGKHITPYLLEKVKKFTKGDSLKVNMALLENNAYIAALISKSISDTG
ncbi:MAG TPA: pseudouridine-5-phosphate glycosidase [Chloroflexi bacterium]|nr:pseudouridine-5-phosphate glycosidase [Chloroflexota bacterium]|tara:strand:- start:5982 stop:6893 length:912 start_codon:yes stop_codon:yes gene_type:complete